jgi:hypothetical protein
LVSRSDDGTGYTTVATWTPPLPPPRTVLPMVTPPLVLVTLVTLVIALAGRSVPYSPSSSPLLLSSSSSSSSS